MFYVPHLYKQGFKSDHTGQYVNHIAVLSFVFSYLHCFVLYLF